MTTSIADLLTRLRERDIRLWLDGERLRFTAPPGALTPELRQELAGRRVELVQLLQAANAPAQAGPPLITPARRDGALPLSFAQQRLWFLDQLEPDSPAYTIPTALHLNGPLDSAALERSLNALVRRHEALRTFFTSQDGQPAQVIAPELNLRLECIDLPPGDPVEREELLNRMINAEARRLFDLTQVPLLRVSLFRIAPEEHVLLVVIHHIVSDGWSQGIFTHELGALYTAECAGKPVDLPALPIQYPDFSIWQRTWLGATERPVFLQTQIDYWKRQLDNAQPVLDLPISRSRPDNQSYNGATIRFTVPDTTVAAIRTLGQRENSTLFMILLAAFQGLLARYTGQNTILVGAAAAGRTSTASEGLIGFFVNSLVMRTDLSGDPTFRELLGRVREVALGAYTNQDLPFEKLVEELQPARNLSYHPIFQVMFVLQNAPGGDIALEGVRARPLAVDTRTAKFDLTLDMEEAGPALRGLFEYNTDLFDAGAIQRLTGHFLTLLAGAVEQPDLRLSALPLLTESERHMLRYAWNATASDYPRNLAIHRIFESQAAATPASVALEFEGQQISYAELNRRANQLARYLQGMGITPDTLVGLCMERSITQIIGLLGILKAGGAYVPLDPTYPAERLAFMIADTGIPVLLTQRALADERWQTADSATRTQLICLDEAWPLIAREAEQNLEDTAGPENLAYVIYTSGSTGRPKGVCVPHRAVVRLVRSTNYITISAADVFLQLAPISFDASTLEVWGSLLNGARLVLMPPQTPSLDELAQALTRHKITVLWLTAGLFHLMVEEQLDSLLGVRQLLAGGDVLSVPHVLKVLRAGSGQTLINGYGPTENTTFTCCYPMTSPDQIATSVPIGHPIANTSVYILDTHQQPVPIGVPGELYTGGDGLAHGYLNRPELTNERFVADPFNATARLYKTGDLARYLEDGRIEFLGRVDHQLKIRGFRIEPGEIETALLAHPAIRDAVVVARDAGRNAAEKRLVAYIIGGAGTPAAELREFLKARLPEYMVPAAFVPLDTLPLNPNGKVDRQALPAPDFGAHSQDITIAGPRTSTEELLASIWARVLGMASVGIHDNFFELGGDSILTIQIIARANQAGLRLTPRQLFQHQTIAALAAVAGNVTNQRIEQAPAIGAAPLTPVQHWFFERELAEMHHWNQAMLLELSRPIDLTVLEQAVQNLLHQHDALRLRFARDGADWHQWFAEPGDHPPVLRVDLTDLPASAHNRAIESRAAALQTSLNLTEGPLIRVALFDLGIGAPARLLIAIHHLAVDGVSWRILLDDLTALCERMGRGELAETILPPRSTSFKYWAERLAEYARSAPVWGELEYWIAQSSQAAALPIDLPGATTPIEASTRIVQVTLDPEETRALLQDVPSTYRTQINDVLLTALAQAFAGWTGQHTLLIDLEGHGREELFEGIDLSRTIGWFTTIFPVALELPATNDPGIALKAVKEQLRRIPHRGIGYGLLRYLHGDPQIAERLANLPQPEVVFNYLGQFDQVLSGDSLFRPTREAAGPIHSPQAARLHQIELDASIVGGQLRVEWSYSADRYQPETITRLGHAFVAALRQIIRHCQAPESGGYSPSDFPLARLDQSTLDSITGTNRQIEDIYPLAPAQHEMLVQSLHASAGVYVVQWSYLLEGALNEPALRHAWQHTIERHSILRSSFAWKEVGQPLQIVHETAELPWEYSDWRGFSEPEQTERLETLLANDRARAYLLYRAPLMRMLLARIADSRHRVIWSHHHLLLDGWSVPQLWKEVFSLYTTICQEIEPRRDSNPIILDRPRPYRDYIAWLNHQPTAEAERFWRATLNGVDAPTPLGISPAEQTERPADYAERHVQPGQAITAALAVLAQRHHLTLNTLAQGAWALVIGVTSGHQDIVFGATVAGRPASLAGVEQMIGLFINTLPLRVTIDSGATLAGWFQEIQDRQVELRQHEYIPLAQIQSWSTIPAGTPLFESFLRFQNYPADPETWQRGADLEISDVQVIDWWHFPISIVVEPGPSLDLAIVYDRHRVPDPLATRMLDKFMFTLEMFAEGLEGHLGDIINRIVEV